MDSYNRGRIDVLLAIKKIADNNEYPEYLEEDIQEYLEKEFKKYEPVIYVDTDSVKYNSKELIDLGAVKYMDNKEDQK